LPPPMKAICNALILLLAMLGRSSECLMKLRRKLSLKQTLLQHCLPNCVFPFRHPGGSYVRAHGW
jgi:hypothetical protein